MSRLFVSLFNRCILAGIYLCHACSFPSSIGASWLGSTYVTPVRTTKLRMETPGQGAWHLADAGAWRRGVRRRHRGGDAGELPMGGEIMGD
jgi:hypothetical protein